LNALFRNLTTRQLVIVGLIVPLLCTLIVGWLQWHVVSQMVEGRYIGRSIRNTQVDLGVFRYSLSDAESAQFRYILTRDPGDLDLCRKLFAQAKAQFVELRNLTTGNSLQQKYLDEIEPLLKTKEANAELSFSLEKGGNHAGAMQIIASDDCRQRMLKIEGAIANMQTVAAQQIGLRQIISTHNLKVTAAASVAGLAINLVCIAAVLLLIRRLQRAQANVTSDAIREMVNYHDGKLTIEEYLSRRSAALTTHGNAQIEAEKIISQLERSKARSATTRIPPVQTPPK
jgi:CHASE3 domain sensor protein